MANETTAKENTGIHPSQVPIVLELNLEKVQYILGLLGTLPYDKVVMVIQDIHIIASPQVDKFNAEQAAKAEAAAMAAANS